MRTLCKWPPGNTAQLTISSQVNELLDSVHACEIKGWRCFRQSCVICQKGFRLQAQVKNLAANLGSGSHDAAICLQEGDQWLSLCLPCGIGVVRGQQEEKSQLVRNDLRNDQPTYPMCILLQRHGSTLCMHHNKPGNPYLADAENCPKTI